MTATLLPPNATPLETAIAATMAARLDALACDLRALWNPQTCPEPLLPWLAATVAVEQWSDAWPLSLRRARIASAIAIHRAKGTAQAVQDVIAAYGGTFHLTEWWQTTPPGPPHTFALSVAIGGAIAAPAAELITAMTADIDRVKPARAHYTLSVATHAAAAPGVIGAARGASYARLSLTT